MITSIQITIQNKKETFLSLFNSLVHQKIQLNYG